MEAALAKDDAAQHAAHEETDAFAGYQTAMRVGRRDDARTDLARAIAVAARAGDYRRLLDQLDTAMLTAGKLELKRTGKPLIVACAAAKIVLGRDPLCDLTLRAGGVSRQHAEVERDADGFSLRDLDSRNGTKLAGLPLVGQACRSWARASFALGDECAIDFEVTGGVLVLRVRGGLDRGVALIAGADGARLDPSRHSASGSTSVFSAAAHSSAVAAVGS